MVLLQFVFVDKEKAEMKKLTDKTKYDIHEDGYAIIYAKKKGEDKWSIFGTCHSSCIPLIKKANKLFTDNVFISPC